jgi:hypothetical protein
MKFGRLPGPGEVQLVADLETAREALLRSEREASAAVAAARGQVAAAQSRVDEFRVRLVREHAAAWRERAQRLRREAEDAGDSTIVVPVRTVGGLDGDSVEPQLRYRRAVLLESAGQADRRSTWIDGDLARGDALDSQALAALVSQLDPLPDEAAETASV